MKDYIGYIFAIGLITVIALCTHWGNEQICRRGWAPTFIDCSKLSRSASDTVETQSVEDTFETQ